MAVGYSDGIDDETHFFSLGIATVGSSPEQFAVRVKIDMAKLGKLIKDTGVRAD